MSNLTCGLYGYMGAKGADAENYSEMFRRINQNGEKITRFVDTNFGAGNIIAAACDYEERVSNDINEDIALLAKMVSSAETRAQVLDILLDMEVSREVYKMCKDALKSREDIPDIKKAAYSWYISEYSFNGNSRNFSSNHRVDRLFHKVQKLSAFDGVEILNMDMVDLLEQEKKNSARMEKTMYYLDPPYLDNNARYAHNMTSEAEHKRLLEVMKDIPNIMISGYDSELYNNILCKEYGFHKYSMGDKWISMNAVSVGSIRKQKTEYVWTSYEVRGPYQQ